MNHWNQVARALEENGLDAMLLTGSANRFYVTGFASDDEGGVALVTRKGNFFFTDARYMEAAEQQIEHAAFGLVDGRKGYIQWLTEALDLAGAKQVGFEEDRMTVAQWQRYTEQLPCTLQPASALMATLRSRKDPEELERMRQAQRIAEQAFGQLLQEMHPGMTERQIAARLQYLAISAGAERMSFSTIVASGPNSSVPHAVPTDRAIREGDFVTIDFGCVYRGYCSDMTRTLAVGAVTEEMEQVYDLVLRAQEAGLRTARAGLTGQEVDAAAREVIEAGGFGPYFTHSLGHSLGVEIHEGPNATPGNRQSLPEDAVISIEPGIYLPGRFGVRIEDTVILRRDGCEDLMTMGRELVHL